MQWTEGVLSQCRQSAPVCFRPSTIRVLLHLGFSIMRSEELAFVNHLHEFNPRDDASGVVEQLKAKHEL